MRERAYILISIPSYWSGNETKQPSEFARDWTEFPRPQFLELRVVSNSNANL